MLRPLIRSAWDTAAFGCNLHLAISPSRFPTHSCLSSNLILSPTVCKQKEFAFVISWAGKTVFLLLGPQDLTAASCRLHPGSDSSRSYLGGHPPTPTVHRHQGKKELQHMISPPFFFRPLTLFGKDCSHFCLLTPHNDIPLRYRSIRI